MSKYQVLMAGDDLVRLQSDDAERAGKTGQPATIDFHRAPQGQPLALGRSLTAGTVVELEFTVGKA